MEAEPPAKAPEAANAAVSFESAAITRKQLWAARWAKWGAFGLIVVPAFLELIRATFPIFYVSDVWTATATAFQHNLLGAGCLALLSVVFASGRLTGRPPGPVVASDAGLTVSPKGRETETIPRARIRDGLMVPSQPGPHVELRLDDGDRWQIDVASEEEASRVLAALGLGVETRRVSLPIDGPNRQLKAGCLVYAVGAVSLTAVIIAFVLWKGNADGLRWITSIHGWVVMAALAASLWWSAPREVVVGVDGVLVGQTFGHRFFSYATLVGAQTLGSDLGLVQEGGEVFRVHVRGKEAPGVVAALAQRIREAMGRKREGADPLSRAGLFVPPGGSASAFREALVAFASKAGDYRRQALDEEALLSALDDPTATNRTRIGAAIALRAAGTEGAPKRIRIAADACAGEGLRGALTKAAEDKLEDSEIEALLAEEEQQQVERQSEKEG